MLNLTLINNKGLVNGHVMLLNVRANGRKIRTTLNGLNLSASLLNGNLNRLSVMANRLVNFKIVMARQDVNTLDNRRSFTNLLSLLRYAKTKDKDQATYNGQGRRNSAKRRDHDLTGRLVVRRSGPLS